VAAQQQLSWLGEGSRRWLRDDKSALVSLDEGSGRRLLNDRLLLLLDEGS
jgi:hypothetical protein